MRGFKDYYIKASTPDRPVGSVERRTDFMYMDGHGTYYRFEDGYIPYDLPKKKIGERVTVVMYNLNTDRLDEVSFKLLSKNTIGAYLYMLGNVECDESYFAIQIYYNLVRPENGDIIVLQTPPHPLNKLIP